MLGWAAGFVRAGVVWVLLVGEDGDEGLRHPGLAGGAHFSFALIGHGQSRMRQRLFPWPSQV
jgi:hypothetical protein